MHELIQVLCVDDEINILNVVRRQLDDEEFEVQTALTVEEGLQILAQKTPIHVVLSDFRMPGMNGVEFLQQVARVRPEAVGIVLSGFADIPAVRQALEKDALFSFIAKPWKASELRKAVMDAAALSNLRSREEGSLP